MSKRILQIENQNISDDYMKWLLSTTIICRTSHAFRCMEYSNIHSYFHRQQCLALCGSIVNPGVPTGDKTVIVSGSVVTKDVPVNVIVIGNSCRVKSKITEMYKSGFLEMLRNELKNTDTYR